MAAAPRLVGGGMLALGLAWAVAIPPCDAPDEPSHLNAVMQIRRHGRLPIARFRFDRDPKGELADTPVEADVVAYARRCGVDDPLKLEPYESFQPPLFYAVAAAAALPFPDDPATVLYVARVVSVAFAALAVGLIAGATRALAPDEPALAIGAAAVVGLIPQFAFNGATAGNDAAINALFAAAFFLFIRAIRRPDSDPRLIRCGIASGLAILTKLSGLALLPGLALIVGFKALDEPGGRRLRSLARAALASALAVAATCGWWFARNAVLLGDPTATRDASRYYRARFVPMRIGSAEDWRLLLATTGESAIARFGWMNKGLPATAYAVTWAVLVGLAAATLGMLVAKARRGWRPSRASRHAATVLAAVSLGVVLLYLQINFGVGYQAQGRYLFPAALPIGLAIAAGLTLRGPLRAARLSAFGLAIAWLAALQVVSLGKVAGIW